MFAAQFRNELVKLFSRKRTYIGFAAFIFTEFVILVLLSLPKVLAVFRKLVTQNGLEFDRYNSGLTLATFIIFFTVVILYTLYLALVSGDMVAKEVEDGTMRMILNRPVTRAHLIVQKIMACVVHTCVLGLFIGITALLLASLYQGGMGHLLVFDPREDVFAVFGPTEGLWRYSVAVGLMCLTFQPISAMALMLSCFDIRPAAATVVTLTVFSIDMILRSIPLFEPIERYLIGHHVSCWVRSFRHTMSWAETSESLLLLAGLTITCWVIGGAHFCTRDFKA